MSDFRRFLAFPFALTGFGILTMAEIIGGYEFDIKEKEAKG